MMRHLLHVGCGYPGPDKLPVPFRGAGWREVRVDIDPDVAPDIVADMCRLDAIGDATIDAVWSSHNLEHLHAFEVPVALRELRRVLKPDGFLAVTLPDLEAVARHIIAGNLDRPLYSAAAGVVTPLDMMFGHQASIARGKASMAHRTGFTAETLGRALAEAGFAQARVRAGRHWALWAVALMQDAPASVFDDMEALFQ